jgi:LytS/YehU family sensor histidine kinase
MDDIYYISLLDEMILVGLILFSILIFTIVDLSIFLLRKWRFSLAELERFKKENAEFRFESLRSQVNPHFLFNSLNTLSSLVYEDQAKAEQFIRELSDVYRYILENRENEVIRLDKELAVAQSYIYLNRIRFGNNLQVKIDIPESSKSLLIAPFTLQLLIENSIKHNVISTKKPLSIMIGQEDNYLVVKNNMQKKEVKEYSSAMGLKNINSRYGFLTDRKVEINENENEFIVKIPLIESK